MLEKMPSYKELPVVEGAPPGSAWGLFGADDQIGMLNLLTNERTVKAAGCVTKGAVFPLNLPLHLPPRRKTRRGNPKHHLLHVGYEVKGPELDHDEPGLGFMDRDDYIEDLYMQGSTQWDGFTHIRHPEYGNYNGVEDTDVHDGPGGKLGIDQWARRAVVGRGVLLDIERYLRSQGRAPDQRDNYAITVDDLRGAQARQGLTIDDGDILLIHTGWLQYFLEADDEFQDRAMSAAGQRVPGLEPCDEMIEYLWELHIAAIAGDVMAVEQYPPRDPDDAWKLHLSWLPLWGLPVGEWWVLTDLAADCENDRQYRCLVVSVPLNLRGGAGSPAQAVAIK